MRNIYTTGKLFLYILLLFCCLPGLSLAEPLQDISLSGRYAISGALGRDQQQYHIRQEQTGGFLENSMQAFTALLSDSGSLKIKHLEHRIRMRLDGIGIEKNIGNVTPVDVSTSVNRITYDYGMLKQWFVNGPMGLQQGFTLDRRPVGDQKGNLVIILAAEGDLHPLTASGGSRVDFLSKDGTTVLTYFGLLVVDAAGKHLPAHLEAINNTIRIVVNDNDARYPVVVDPVFQSAKLTADDGAAGDSFGRSVAIDGDIVVVGAPSNDIGGNCDQGSVYVFRRTGSGWTNMTQTAKLIAGDGTAGDWFASSVAIDNDIIIVGAENAGAGSLGPGAAYVYVKPASGWVNMTQSAKLTASDGGDHEHFGKAVSINGNTIVVGAFMNSSTHRFQGAAYVFVRPDSGWMDMTETAKLTASDGTVGDSLGISVAIDSDTIVVGAPGNTRDQGAIYVFVRPGSGWSDMTQTAKLMARDRSDGDSLGVAVTIQANTIVAGASGLHETGQTNQGGVYVFEKSGSAWIDHEDTALLRADDALSGDKFGYSISLNNNTIVVGSPYHNYSGTSSNGLPFLVANMGAVYAFQKPACGWQDMRTKAKFLSNDGRADDHLGRSVALSGVTVVAGAPEHTVNNNQGQGAAYVFRYKKKSSWPMFISAATSFIGYVTAMYDKTNFPKCDITNSAKITTHRIFVIHFTESITNKVIPHFSANEMILCYTAMPVIGNSSQLICMDGNLEYDAVEDDGGTKIRRKGHIEIHPTGTCNKRSRSCTVYPNEQGSETIWQWYKEGNTWKLVPGMPVDMPIDWSGAPVYFRNIDFINGGGSSRMGVSTATGEVEYTLRALHWGSRNKSICSGQ